MARISGINIPLTKHIVIGLTSIYGIGTSRARQICTAASVNPQTAVKDLAEPEVAKLKGALYIAGVCLLPEIFRMFYPSVPFNFGGTSLLILVVVTMDFMSQMQAHAMSHQYEGMMQKANLRNYGRSGSIR